MGNTSITPLLFFKAIVSPVLYNDASPFRIASNELNGIEVHCLIDGVPVGSTIEELRSDTQKRILTDFISLGKALLHIFPDNLEKAIIGNVHLLLNQCHEDGLTLRDYAQALTMVREFVRSQLCYVSMPMYGASVLRELYAEAKTVTSNEPLTSSNSADVMMCYHALVEHSLWVCRMLLRRYAGLFLLRVVDALSREFDVQPCCPNMNG